MGKIEVTCPKCSSRYRIDEASLGKRGRCAKCNTRFVLAVVATPPTPPAGATENSVRRDLAKAATEEARPQAEVTQAAESPPGPELQVVGPSQPGQGSDALAAETSVGQTVEQEAEPRIGPAMAPPEGEDVSAGEAAEEDVPLEWNKGDVILDLYEVKDVLGEGGFGKVYKVRHRNWNIDLAVKSPQPGQFTTEAQKDNFVRECETWINLGLHPNIVSCHYVRTLGGIPRVFAEYVEGGSLKDWIDDRRLYEGGQEEALKRILDIAIQFAWGLHYAHEHEGGLVHQDVKPANVLMTPDGVAKVSDFGLAQARAAGGEGEPPAQAGRTMLVPGVGFMTREYASPEQAAGQPLTRKTDIWSWGVSILHMFTGEVTWMSGMAAAEVLESYLESGAEDESIPKMPEAVAGLLRHCFRKDPAERPNDMQEIAGSLREICREATDQEYRREEPKAVELLADQLNNLALSALDLGRLREAEHHWKAALQRDPQHLETIYNRGVTQWRRGEQTDERLIQEIESARSSHIDLARVGHALAFVHLERGDVRSATPLLKERATSAANDINVQKALVAAQVATGQSQTVSWTLEGHAKYVTRISFSADGRLALSASADDTARLWDLLTGRCLQVLRGHARSVNATSLSADGHLALTGSGDLTLRLWDSATGDCTRVFRGHRKFLTHVCLSEDGHLAISASYDRVMKVWDTRTGACLQSFRGGHTHKTDITCLCLSNDGRLALSGSEDRTLRLWDTGTGSCLRVLKGHTGKVRSVSMNADCTLALSGSAKHFTPHEEIEDALRVWDVNTGSCLRVLKGHTAGVLSVSLSADGRLALSGSGDSSSSTDSTVRLWSVTTGRCLRTFKGHHRASQISVRLTRDADLVVSGAGVEGSEGKLTILVHESPQSNTYVCPLLVSQPKCHIVLSEGEKRVAALLHDAKRATADGEYSSALDSVRAVRKTPGFERARPALSAWRDVAQHCCRVGIRAAWPKAVLAGHRAGITSLAISPKGRFCVSGSDDNTLCLWDIDSGQQLRVFRGHKENGVDCVIFSSDGNLVLSCGGDNTIRLWEAATGACIRVFEGHRSTVNSISLSPDDRWLLSGSGGVGLFGSFDKTVRLWEVSTGRCLRIFGGNHDVIECVSFAMGGRVALAGGWDHHIHMWDVPTGQNLSMFAGHTGNVLGIAVTRDGLRFLSCAHDKQAQTVRLWDVTKGRCDGVFRCHERVVMSAVPSVDGRFAVTAGYDDRTVRLWDIGRSREGVMNRIMARMVGWEQNKGCQRMWSLEGHSQPVTAIALSDNGRWIVSGSHDATVRLWELDWELEARKQVDWNEAARRYLQAFLIQQTPYTCSLPTDQKPTEDDLRLVLTHRGQPHWTEADFQRLLATLGCAGFGWLRPEGVRRQLEKMTREWTGLPPLPGQSEAVSGPVEAIPRHSPREQEVIRVQTPKPVSAEEVKTASDSPEANGAGKAARMPGQVRKAPTPVGRNDPCPCGSGRKFKNCCMRKGRAAGVIPARAGQTDGATCSCGFENPPGNQFCNQCGKRLSPASKATCPHCRKAVPSGVKFCVHCGKNIKA